MIPKVISLFSLTAIILISISSCTNKNQQTLLGDICDTSNATYTLFVSPLMTSKCLSCHNNSYSQGGVSVEGYSNVSLHATKILSTIKDGSMPKGGSPLDNCTVTKLEKWINDGKLNN